MRYFEDLNEGDVFQLGEVVLGEDEIIEFAKKYDPQPFHIDKAAAAKSHFGGLIASGWHTGSAFMGVLVRSLFGDVASLGSGGIEELRWLKPVRANQRLKASLKLLQKKASKPGRGTVLMEGELVDESGARVFYIRWPALVATRPND